MSDRQIADLARYLNMIIGTRNEKLQTLTSLRKRGAIPGLYVEAGGVDDDERATCCDPADHGVIDDDPTVRNPWTGDFGNAPAEYQSTPEGVTNCEEGGNQAISVNFVGGFSQAETCKECGPDETWLGLVYWVTDTPAAPDNPSPSARDCCYDTVAGFSGGWSVSKVEVLEDDNSVGGRCWYFPISNPSNESYFFMDTRYCGQAQYDSGVCTAEPPDVCGDDWEQDSTIQYTLRNGCYVASKCDPDAPTSALGCNEELTLCQDGVPWTFRPTSDGGWIQYDPDGIRTGGKYDGRTGIRTAVIPPGQESMY